MITNYSEVILTCKPLNCHVLFIISHVNINYLFCNNYYNYVYTAYYRKQGFYSAHVTAYRSNDMARPHNQIAIVHGFTRPSHKASSARTYTLLKPWDCILDRHIMMVSVFRSLVFCDSLRRICTQDSALRDLSEGRYRLSLYAPFI